MAGSQISGGAGDDTITGGPDKDILNGGAGDDIVNGGPGNDILDGGAGSDRLDGGAGIQCYTPDSGSDNDILDGGAGFDTAVFSLMRSNYRIIRYADSTEGTTVTMREWGIAYLAACGAGTGSGDDILYNIERLSFADGTLDFDTSRNSGGMLGFDTSGNSWVMYRLYKAAFDRLPDLPGFGHNISLMDAGLTTLAQMADAFVQSAEFTNKYGALSNAQFIERLYLNVLDRAPDEPGLIHNLNLLNTALTRAEMLAAYSESAENQLNVIGQIQNGIWFT